MSDKCPNCGSGETHQETHTLERWCLECGTLYYGDGSKTQHVPTRSRPAEVKELPDAEGWWWTYDAKLQNWFLIEVDDASVWRKDRYVRAVPPIIAPAKPDPDPDAEKLRRMADYSSGALVFPISRELAEQFCRIADDLERLKREAKEAGR